MIIAVIKAAKGFTDSLSGSKVIHGQFKMALGMMWFMNDEWDFEGWVVVLLHAPDARRSQTIPKCWESGTEKFIAGPCKEVGDSCLKTPKLPKSRSVMSQHFVTAWAVAHQAALSMGFLHARILAWVAIQFLQGNFPTQGLNSGLTYYRRILYELTHQGNSPKAFSKALL